MADHSTISIQESTAGGVTQFLELEGCECIQSIKLLSFLSGALQRYEEEGVLLNPKLLLCSSIEKFCATLPGGRFIVVGRSPYTSETGKNVLKQCATLAKSGWHVFVERSADGNETRFGVFSYLESPTSLSLKEILEIGSEDLSIDNEFSVSIEQLDPKTILMTGSKGNSLTIAFSTTRIASEGKEALKEFACMCVAGCNESDSELYFHTLLTRCLNESHGTILACLPTGSITEVAGMQDAVVIDPPLDLLTAFTNYKTSNSADAILELQRCEALLTGMLQSDGIVIFDDQGRVSAYRVFYREPAPSNTGDAPASTQGKKKPIGGARRRAFEGVKALVGATLKGALFRSQDGLTEFHGG